jgi:hypothetical protein
MGATFSIPKGKGEIYIFLYPRALVKFYINALFLLHLTLLNEKLSNEILIREKLNI